MRLAFSVAIHSRPDVLLVDEVLAVGDLAFQRKRLRQDSRNCEAADAASSWFHTIPFLSRICATVRSGYRKVKL